MYISAECLPVSLSRDWASMLVQLSYRRERENKKKQNAKYAAFSVLN